MFNQILTALLICSILLGSHAANAESDLLPPQFKSGAYTTMSVVLDFRSLAQSAGEIYDIIEWDDSHIVWQFPTTRDRAFFFANGRVMVASESDFDAALKSTLDRELNEVLDTLDQAGARITRSARDSSLESLVYYAGSGEMPNTRSIDELYAKLEPLRYENLSVSIHNETFPGGIISTDATSFPQVNIKLFINTFCARSGGIKATDFYIEEDGMARSVNKRCYNCTQAAISKIDLAIVFDDTESMGGSIKSLKDDVANLTGKISSAKIDSRYYLTTFKEDVSPLKSEWTNDRATLQRFVTYLYPSGGDSIYPENALGAIEKALSAGFRSDALRIIVVITDERSHQIGDGSIHSTHSFSQVSGDLRNSSVLLVAISPDFPDANIEHEVPRKDVDLRDLANETKGLWIDIKDVDFSNLYDQIKGVIKGSYIIGYLSSNPQPNTERMVRVTVDSPSCDGATGSALVTYVSPQIGDRFVN